MFFQSAAAVWAKCWSWPLHQITRPEECGRCYGEQSSKWPRRVSSLHTESLKNACKTFEKRSVGLQCEPSRTLHPCIMTWVEYHMFAHLFKPQSFKQTSPIRKGRIINKQAVINQQNPVWVLVFPSIKDRLRELDRITGNVSICSCFRGLFVTASCPNNNISMHIFITFRWKHVFSSVEKDCSALP